MTIILVEDTCRPVDRSTVLINITLENYSLHQLASCLIYSHALIE